MMKRILGLLCAFLSLPWCVSNAAYTEISTSQGKIIRGLSRDEAIERYGYPQAVGEETWLYRKGGEDIYVDLPSVPVLSLYPKSVNIQLGSVVELKAFAGVSGGTIADVTGDVVFFVSDPAAFTIRNHDVFIPKKAGEYTVVARYKGNSSNACRISVAKPDKKEDGIAEEKLLGIEVLPHAPVVYAGEELRFIAMGVFSFGQGNYEVRDISDEAEWTVSGDNARTGAQGRNISFPAEGRAKVSCRYKGVASYIQNVTVEPLSLARRSEQLRHLTILPDLMTVPTAKAFTVTVMATYEDNRVRDVTADCRYDLQKDRCLVPEKPGTFSGVEEGVCEVFAETGGLRSGMLKVIVTSGEGASDPRAAAAPEKKKASPKQAEKDIENEVAKLAQKISPPDKKVVSIKVFPPEIALETKATGNLRATAFHSDGSQSDVTVTAVWTVADASCAGVDKGVVTARIPGETPVTVQYKSVQSPPARIVVKKPHLVSIALTPESVRISMFQRPRLKAEGVFSDSARKDMSGEVSWRTQGNAASVDRGSVHPRHFGTGKVFARSGDIESLPASVTVVITPLWIALVAGCVLLVLLALAGVVVFFLYMNVKRKAESIRQLRSNPAAYSIALYDNARGVLSLFGFSAHFSDCPLDAAARAEEKFGFGKQYHRFTQHYEEAKYSKHCLPPERADEVGKMYFSVVSVLFAELRHLRKGKILLASLIRKIPLFL